MGSGRSRRSESAAVDGRRRPSPRRAPSSRLPPCRDAGPGRSPNRPRFSDEASRSTTDSTCSPTTCESCPTWQPVPTRRARRSDRGDVIAVDQLAFPPFWRFDSAGLDEALAATPSHRHRVAGDPVHGYSVWGRAHQRGYLQRLAVHPDHAGRGIGAGMVLDGLRWLRRWRVTEALVNTQDDNDRALGLYERLGLPTTHPRARRPVLRPDRPLMPRHHRLVGMLGLSALLLVVLGTPRAAAAGSDDSPAEIRPDAGGPDVLRRT